MFVDKWNFSPAWAPSVVQSVARKTKAKGRRTEMQSFVFLNLFFDLVFGRQLFRVWAGYARAAQLGSG